IITEHTKSGIANLFEYDWYPLDITYLVIRLAFQQQGTKTFFTDAHNHITFVIPSDDVLFDCMSSEIFHVNRRSEKSFSLLCTSIKLSNTYPFIARKRISMRKAYHSAVPKFITFTMSRLLLRNPFGIRCP